MTAAMSFTNRVSQQLHEEHRATVALMERLEQMIARYRRGGPPAVSDAAVKQLLTDLVAGVQGEIERHFSFEEDQLFTYLTEMGDEAIGAHLTEEHRAIRPIGSRIAMLARDAAVQGFDETKWSEFCRLGQELSERLLMHVQKEEMALLPLLEADMDADTEARLYREYVEIA
jgi:hemerythrin-like domain-containing protein